MRLRVIGCHGGATSYHRNVSFLLNGSIAVDAGSLASGLDLDEQAKLETIVVTHSHLDHVGDLASLCDTRAQQDTSPLTVAAIPETIEALRTHYFNNVLWPNFEMIPMAGGPTLNYRQMQLEEAIELDGLEITPILMDHSIPAAGLLIQEGSNLVAYTGDTGPTERFWEVLNQRQNLRALITEVSFPNEKEELARLSGHMTPNMLADELAKLKRRPDQGTFIYGMKPVFLKEITEQMKALEPEGVQLLSLRDSFEF